MCVVDSDISKSSYLEIPRDARRKACDRSDRTAFAVAEQDQTPLQNGEIDPCLTADAT